MRRSAFAKLVIGASLAGAAAMVPVAALASPGYADSISGIEIAATSTQGTFVGVALGQLPGTWQATIAHQPLTSGTVPINGGTLYLAGSLGGQPATVTGGFAGSGTITQTGGFWGCANQTYYVTDSLSGLTLTTGAGSESGSGSFAAVLTHYRTRIFGVCVTYGAGVSGGVSFQF